AVTSSGAWFGFSRAGPPRDFAAPQPASASTVAATPRAAQIRGVMRKASGVSPARTSPRGGARPPPVEGDALRRHDPQPNRTGAASGSQQGSVRAERHAADHTGMVEALGDTTRGHAPHLDGGRAVLGQGAA